jgi:tRNA modification GTPase
VDKAATDIPLYLKAHLATAPTGEQIREGAIVVIAGPPNAGKSSLFNALLGRSRAIVTEMPGTTRDALEAVIDSGKWPLRLVDTAGLRETTDRVEQLGIEVSERYLADAHVVLACAETSDSLQETIKVIAKNSSATVLPIRTKADLVSVRDEISANQPGLAVSAETGAGLQELLEAIDELLAREHGEVAPDLPILTRARHRHALSTACSEIEQFRRAWHEDNLPATIASVHLRTAVTTLEELIGTVEVEDVFDRVFSSFCVGK